MPTFSIRLAGADLIFSAAHFITLDCGVCEPLHGHNYRVSAEAFGALDENRYVFDFVAAGRILRAILAELDHAVLLPTDHPAIRVAAGPEEVEVTFPGRRWVFPRSECRLLPIANTTAELMAEYIGRRLFDAIAAETGIRPAKLRLELEEWNGNSAICEL